MEFYNKTIQETEKELKTNSKKGLSTEEVSQRRTKHGYNVIERTKRINPFIIFVRQFRSFIIYILLFAVIVSIIAKEYIDSTVILAILVFNAFFGFFQEYKAEKSIQALKKLTAQKSRVIRNGTISIIDAKEIVPGDIIVLEEGDKISADARLIESISLQTMEASLTGESNPVGKSIEPINKEITIADMKNSVFAGTSITKGHGKAIVTATAMNTEIGKIAGLISEVEKEETPLQKKLQSLGKYIGAGVLLISAIVFITGAIKENLFSLLLSGQYAEFLIGSQEWFLTAVALAVAAVPEGLPAIVTIALALGVRRMLKRNSLIRRLPSIETLGETTVICSDKTGTITKNEMTVRRAYVFDNDIKITGEGYSLRGKATFNEKPVPKPIQLLFKIGILCNNSILENQKGSVKIIGDPTEAALLISAEKVGINHEELRKRWNRIHEEPFDSSRKMMSTVHINPKTKEKLVYVKGAPEKILEKCTKYYDSGTIRPLSDKVRNKILNKNEDLASQALRVLGFAFKDYSSDKNLEQELVFVGLQGMIDPARPEIKDSVQKCNDAGIRVIMVTGDNPMTAKAIAKEIGLTGKVITGTQFESLSGREQITTIKTVSVFARVEPVHKLRIVELLQKEGNVVAMTGDGVNDAPALKKADIGVAMGIKGTDVSKEASDMVLQDDNFSSIVNSVEEGRGIYENIQKFVNYLLSSNVAEVMVIFIAILIGWPLPMTAIMLLWLNLVTDGLPALSLAVDPNSKNLMSKKPKTAKERIMNRSMTFNIIFVSSLITLAVLSIFYWGMVYYDHLEPSQLLMKIQTLAFTAIIVMELVRLQAIRSEYKLGIFSNKYLILAVVASIGLQLLVIYTPLNFYFGTTFLGLADWSVIISATAIVLMLNMFGVSIKNRMRWFED